MQNINVEFGDIHFRIDASIKKILVELADENDMTLTAFMIKMIKTNLRRIGKIE